MFEGIMSLRAVLAALESGQSDRKIERVIFDRSRKKARAGELSYLTAMSFKYGFPLIPADAETISSLALGTSHGGLLMETTARSYPRLTAERLAADFPDPGSRFFAMIEGIEDPYNFGYAIRSIWAAGVSAIVLTERSWMSAAGVVCRSSAGASEICPMYVAGPGECAKIMKDSGVKIVCCDMKHSVSMYEADLSKPIFLAVGGEKRGLSRELLDAADAVIRLDYGRAFPAALSAASAATIASFEVFRQNLRG